MPINAEIKNFVKQLRKTNAQHKTWPMTWPNYVECNNETHYPEMGLLSLDTTQVKGIRPLFVQLSIVLVIPNVCNVVNKLVVCVLSVKVSWCVEWRVYVETHVKLWIIHKTLINWCCLSTDETLNECCMGYIKTHGGGLGKPRTTL